MTHERQPHVIFQSQNGDKSRNDGWLDYCREEPGPGSDDVIRIWADEQSHALARRIGCPVRYRIEVW